jgi:hypothetical protein
MQVGRYLLFKKGGLEMITRFTYELVVGIIYLIAVLLFGEHGMIAMALLAAHPFIGKKKADERESQLFNKVGNYTAGVTLVACVIIYEMTNVVVNGNKIGDLWLYYACCAFLIAHGAAGLIIFKRG